LFEVEVLLPVTGGDQQEVFSMPSNDWDVPGALDEVVQEIQKGSSLSIKGVEKGYKQRYNKDFQDHWDADSSLNPVPGHYWPGARKRILPLARLVGRLATILTYQASQSGPIPTDVDTSSAYMAGYLVAKGLCPPGVWCMSYYYESKQEPQQELLDKVKDEFQKFLVLIREIQAQ
jgi:hypothetical protein